MQVPLLNRLQHPKRLALVISALLLIQACGIKFWYNRLDWLVPWYIDDYVELTSQQEDSLEKLIELKTEWHRSHELPKYIALLDRMSADIKSGAIHQTYDHYRLELRRFYDTILIELSDELVAQMASLSDQQIEQFFSTLEKAANDAYKEYQELTSEELQAETLESLEDSFAEWIGRLSNEQKALINELAHKLKPSFEQAHQFRAQWRDAFRTALAERHSDSGKAAIKSLLLDPYQLGGEALNSTRRYNSELYKEYHLKIYRTLSNKQKNKLLDNLEDYRDDFKDLTDN